MHIPVLKEHQNHLGFLLPFSNQSGLWFIPNQQIYRVLLMTSFWKHPFACTKKDGVFPCRICFPYDTLCVDKLRKIERLIWPTPRSLVLCKREVWFSWSFDDACPRIQLSVECCRSFFFTPLFTLGYSYEEMIRHVEKEIRNGSMDFWELYFASQCWRFRKFGGHQLIW